MTARASRGVVALATIPVSVVFASWPGLASETMCRPCLSDFDCVDPAAGEASDCVPWGQEGSFCLSSCDPEECPWSYECLALEPAEGISGQWCVPVSGVCPCSVAAILDGAETECFSQSQWGTCVGTRECTLFGLSECSAAVPLEELCNGEDDDCDGATDEGLKPVPCLVVDAHGFCPGLLVCQGGTLVCQGQAPEKETCDGLDNNCNGLIDELPECPGYAEQLPEPSCGIWLQQCKSEAESCNGKDDDCDLAVDEGFADHDGDGYQDCVDLDDDDDGYPDGIDCGPLDAPIHPGAQEWCNGVDDDCDGLVDEGFKDTDLDGQADCVDGDLDGDQVENAKDNCPEQQDSSQADSDGDGIGDMCDVDADGDGAIDAADNCPGDFNPGQEDQDQDGAGDACDPDLDGDGVADGGDNCPSLPNPGQEDADGDMVGDLCDDDIDGDGWSENWDCFPIDAASHPQAIELCDQIDNDCDGLVDEGLPDTDKDGTADCEDLDDDGDGDPDATDCGPADASIGHFAEEVCDGVDNDCDGETDELGMQSCGAGKCKHQVAVCLSGEEVVCNPYDAATSEKCNGEDDDCDGLVDEDFALGGECWTGLGECAMAGKTVCAAGGLSVKCDAKALSPSCGGKTCGPDGCGGECGVCAVDDLPCTHHVCADGECKKVVDPTQCLIAGVCVSAWSLAPDNPCYWCNLDVSQCQWVPRPDGEPCGEGAVCKKGSCCVRKCAGKECGPDGCGGECGQCKSWACFSTSCSAGKCQASTANGYCQIDGICYSDGQYEPGNPCKICNSTFSKTMWKSFTGIPCGQAGKCWNGSCL